MKAFQFFRVVIILSGIFLSACAGAPSGQAVASAVSAGGDKPISEVVFTGVIEGMNENQWVINGQPVTVDSSILRDGPFAVGDTVKVEARVAGDGSVTAQRVESPAAVIAVETATSTPDASSTQASPAVDNRGNEAVGKVESITDTSITLGGQTFSFIPGTEIKGAITVGTTVKLHFITNADGTLSVREVEISNPAQAASTSSVDDNSNSNNTNDDHSSGNGSDDPPGDDKGNDDSSNDDNGNDDNDDHSNDDNSNDGSGHG